MTDLLGFVDDIPNLRIKLKSGGYANLGEVAYANQTRFWDRIANHRRTVTTPGVMSRFCEFDIKIRQFAAFSTAVGGFIKADCSRNAGFDGYVVAHRKPSLMELNQMYRNFFGRTKDAGQVERMSDTMFVANNGSKISVQMADADTGRSGSAVYLHMSEAHYIENFEETWKSVEPSLAETPWTTVVFETTMRKGLANQFRDVMEAAARGEFPPWKVNFTAWHELPAMRVTLTSSARESLIEKLTDYEMMLYRKLKLSLEQVAWHRNKRIGGMFGSLEAMQEAYPTTLEEALSAGFGGEFFRKEAIRHYDSMLKPPILRMRVTYDGMFKLTEGDSLAEPHLEVWEVPAYGNKYVIGADCADSEKRITIEGSENYAVVVNEDTGAVVAQWHGYSSSSDFAGVLNKLARYYENALVVSEINYGGAAVDDALRKVFGYTHVYQREVFGKTVETVPGVFGFNSTAGTRQILVDRLQRCINDRLFVIPDRGLLDQIKDFGKRGGRAQKRQARANTTPDDGVIALGLTTFGHRKAIDGTWRPKMSWEYQPLINSSKPAPRRGYLVSHDDRVRKRLEFDERLNRWISVTD